MVVEAAHQPSAELADPPLEDTTESVLKPSRFSLRVMRPTISFLASLIVHLVVLLVLALTVMEPTLDRVLNLDAHWSSGEEPLQIFELNSVTPTLDSGLAEADLDMPPVAVSVPPLQQLDPGPAGVSELVQPTTRASADQLGAMLAQTHLPLGGGLEGRSAEMRAQLAGSQGGTPGSEEAVEKGLAWLAAHQRQDGSWHFNYQENTCSICRNSGSASTTTGSTGLVLLAFLGAGYTHEQGKYKDVVDRGLYYLNSRMLLTPNGGDLQEGSMYGHGIATLALCEAYALTNDPTLRPAAQHAIDFICYAQHPEGGWRYFPGQPGDTTVFSWQIMALKSARMSNLEVPSPVIENAMRYLDSVQDMNGATYSYQKNKEKTPVPSAIGILARMYYGWRRDDARISKGIFYLDALGPSKHDMYFNYYATQVLHHYQGSYWTKWNERLREYLIATQATEGHENGSWYFPDQHGKVGGRLYTTAMCTMILEVYYRYMPLYDDPAITTGF